MIANSAGRVGKTMVRGDRYRQRLEGDLDRWIRRGLVPSSSRSAILADIEQPHGQGGRRVLLAAGAALLGLALIAFIAANWDGMSRVVRLTVLFIAFWVPLGAASALTDPGQRWSRECCLLLACLAFSSCVGLLGQLLNMPGEPADALMLATLGSLLLALNGSSRLALAASVGLALLWQVSAAAPEMNEVGLAQLGATDAASAGIIIISGAAAWAWPSRFLSHVFMCGATATLGLSLLKATIDLPEGLRLWSLLMCASGLLLLVSGISRRSAGLPFARAMEGYGAWVALTSYSILGLTLGPGADLFGAATGLWTLLAHRFVWLIAAVSALAYGYRQKHGWVLAAGGLNFLSSTGVLMTDLGFSLLSASGVFLVASLAAISLAFFLGRRKEDAA